MEKLVLTVLGSVRAAVGKCGLPAMTRAYSEGPDLPDVADLPLA